MPQAKFDVFLSRKTEDAALSLEIYRYLREAGLTVFDAGVSLQELGISDYSKAIDMALASCGHLVVVTSASEHASSSWVEAEWRFFLNKKRSGRTKGNLLSVVGEGVSIYDLPPSLQNFEVIPRGELEKLLRYVGGGGPTGEKKSPEPEIGQEKRRAAAPPRSTDLEDRIDDLLQQGWEYYIKTEYNLAYRTYRKAAALGSGQAYTRMGLMQYVGDGVPKDPEMGREMSEKAIELGDLSGHFMIADALDKGLVVPGNPREANERFRKAFPAIKTLAQEADPTALNFLGIYYYNGLGDVEVNYTKAANYFLRAANQGHPGGINNAGQNCENGKGVPQDYEEAYRWYKKGADIGYANCLYGLARMYHLGRGVEQSYDQALPLFRRAADQLKRDAMYYLGLYFENGHAVAVDKSRARWWYRRSALLGDVDAMTSFGVMLYNGIGGETDRVEATKWFEKAAQHNNAYGTYNYAVTLSQSDDPEKRNQAVATYLKAAELDHPTAIVDAARCCYKGIGLMDRHGAEALQVYLAAMKKMRFTDVDYIPKAIAEIYSLGSNTVEPNHTKALRWHLWAAYHGIKSSMEWLIYFYEDRGGKENEVARWKKNKEIGGAVHTFPAMLDGRRVDYKFYIVNRYKEGKTPMDLQLVFAKEFDQPPLIEGIASAIDKAYGIALKHDASFIDILSEVTSGLGVDKKTE